MEILLATHNTHKAEEIQPIFPQKYSLKTLQDIGYVEDIIENGNTFAENAKLKALAGYQFSQLSCFADDSGLCIEALNGKPGIYSARYAGTGKSEDNITKVLQELKDETRRNAYFITVICFYTQKETHFFEGRINGTIIEELRGNRGFGYDPIFIPEGYTKTFAEIPSEEKNRISHRAIATQKFIQFLKQWNSQY